MVALSGELSRQRPWPRIERADGHGLAEVDQPAALLDVQLDEGADAAQRLRSRAQVGRVEPVGAGRLGEGVAVRVPSCGALSGSMAPVISREPRQATPKREPSSSGKTAIASGRRGPTPRACSRSTAASAEATPAGRRTRRLRAPSPGGCRSRRRPAGAAGRVPPGPDDAVAVGLQSSPRRSACSTNHSRSSISAPE